MKKSILTLMIVSIFAFSFAIVGCKKAEAPQDPATEQTGDQPAAPAEEAKDAKKEEAAK
jgi:hypothetical protein